MTKGLLLAGAALVALTCCTPANADTFRADSFSQPGITRDVSVTIGSLTETVRAGEVNLHQNSPSQDLLVWCLDLMDHLFVPYTYNVNTYHAGDVFPGIQTLNGAQTRQIASLMLNGLNLGGADANAATQLAIWKVEYGAALLINGLSGTLLTAFNDEMTRSAAGGSFDCPGCTLLVLTDDVNAPDQAMGTVIVPVPAPIAGAGLPGLLAAGFGLLGLNWKRRRRNGELCRREHQATKSPRMARQHL